MRRLASANQTTKERWRTEPSAASQIAKQVGTRPPAHKKSGGINPPLHSIRLNLGRLDDLSRRRLLGWTRRRLLCPTEIERSRSVAWLVAHRWPDHRSEERRVGKE